MKKVLLFLFASVLFATGFSQQSLFNDGWKFHKGDVPGAEKMTSDTGNWRSVTLPHDWSIEGPFSEEWASATGYLPGGIGWYKKHFLPRQPGKPKSYSSILMAYIKTAVHGLMDTYWATGPMVG